jgi:hypothetical protein
MSARCSFFSDKNTIDDNITIITHFSFIDHKVAWIFTMAAIVQSKIIYNISSRPCISSLRLGLTLCLISSTLDLLKKERQLARPLCLLLKMILFMCFQRLQQPSLMTVLKDQLFTSVNMSKNY